MRRRSSRLQQFAIAVGIGLVVLAFSVVVLVRHGVSQELQNLGMHQNENMARSLSAAGYHHFAPVLAAADAGVPMAVLRDDSSVQTLAHFLEEPLHDLRVVRIKIYSAGGRTAFSTDATQIGTAVGINEGYVKAMSGQTNSKLAHDDAYNVFNRSVGGRDMIETYMPIRDPHGGGIQGVFELYTDMTPLLQQIGAAQRNLLLAPLAIMAVVLAVLYLIFKRTENSLRYEEQHARQYLRELSEAHDTLESRVDERTRELAASEQRFQDVADAAGEYIWELDQQGRFTFVTERVRDVLGYSPEELIGHTPLEFAPQEDVEQVRRFLKERGGEGPFKALEHRTYTRSGELIWLQVNAVPMVDSEGVAVGLRGACSDITARKRAVEALGKMSLATEQSSEVVIITSPVGIIEYVNPAFTEVSGYEAAEVLGRSPHLLQAPEQPPEVYTDLWRTILAGEVWRGELCNQRKDGSLFWNLVSIFPLRDHQMNITHYVALQTDITRRKETDLAIKASEAKLKAVMESVTDPILTCDLSGVIELLNPAACALFGYEEAELIGQNVRILIPERDVASAHRDHGGYLERTAENADSHILEIGVRETEGQRKDGTLIALELSVGTTTVSGRMGFVGVLRDLTDIRRHARELEAARQSSFHREKMAAVGQLAAGIVHEVGNPVAAIVGAVASLRSHAAAADPAAVAERNDGLAMIAEQSNRLIMMTREIADFVRPRSVDKTLLDLNQVVRSAFSLLRYDARVQMLELRLDLDSTIPAITGSADQLTQVILNLVLNAADAGRSTAPGTGFIEISTRARAGVVALAVRDNGEGMDQETLHRSRSPYFSTKKQGAGMGLGLSLCEDIVTQHEGHLGIESQPGEGTTVTLTLPVDKSNWDDV